MMTNNQTLALLSFAAAVIIVIIVNLNIWYYKELTPEERARMDDDNWQSGDW